MNCMPCARPPGNCFKGEHAVGRVIARPFTGQAGDFKRTSNRHDYSLAPPRNILDFIIESGQKVIGIGKIKDLFGGRGVSDNRPTTGNEHGIELLLSAIGDGEGSLIFANLLDFDQVYGHRNNVLGYAEALTRFDKALGGDFGADAQRRPAVHYCRPRQ